MKTCSACRESRPLSDFCRATRSPDGHQYECRPCTATRIRGRRHARHQLTERLVAQGNRCAVCRDEFPDLRAVHIDHDHSCCPGSPDQSCGACTRGLLCKACNLMLGYAYDDPERLLAAVRYLGTSGSQ